MNKLKPAEVAQGAGCILVGSCALNYYSSDVTPNDLDLIVGVAGRDDALRWIGQNIGSRYAGYSCSGFQISEMYPLLGPNVSDAYRFERSGPRGHLLNWEHIDLLVVSDDEYQQLFADSNNHILSEECVRAHREKMAIEGSRKHQQQLFADTQMYLLCKIENSNLIPVHCMSLEEGFKSIDFTTLGYNLGIHSQRRVMCEKVSLYNSKEMALLASTYSEEDLNPITVLSFLERLGSRSNALLDIEQRCAGKYFICTEGMMRDDFYGIATPLQISCKEYDQHHLLDLNQDFHSFLFDSSYEAELRIVQLVDNYRLFPLSYEELIFIRFSQDLYKRSKEGSQKKR